MNRRGPIKEVERTVNSLYLQLCGMSPKRRRTLLKQLERLSGTNCSWLIYDARPMLMSMLTMLTPKRWPVNKATPPGHRLTGEARVSDCTKRNNCKGPRIVGGA